MRRLVFAGYDGTGAPGQTYAFSGEMKAPEGDFDVCGQARSAATWAGCTASFANITNLTSLGDLRGALLDGRPIHKTQSSSWQRLDRPGCTSEARGPLVHELVVHEMFHQVGLFAQLMR